MRDYITNMTISVVKSLGWKKITVVNKGLLQALALTVACQMDIKEVLDTATKHYRYM